jgi:uncharacterized membrane protein
MSDAIRYRLAQTRAERVAVGTQTRRPRPRTFQICAALLVLVLPLAGLHRVWAVQAILILLILLLPGFLLLRALSIPGRVVADFPALVPCASMTVLLFTGLPLDLLGPLVGISDPLSTVPILVSFEVVSAVLLFAGRNAGPNVDVPLTLKNPISLAYPLILPLITILGAQRLNNGYSNKVAIVGILLCILLLVIVMFLASRLADSFLMMLLFSAGLALMYSYSLRGDLVYGFDISTEYQVLTETVTSGVWHATHYNDAYGAMLSLTIMPTEMHFISGVSALMIFKLVYPIIGAIFPLAVYVLARRVLSRTWSFIAAAIIIAQSGFMQEFPALARQEIGLAMFGALVAVMLYRPPRRATQLGLIVLLALSMVVSHYSTTYVAITVFGAAMAIQWIMSWFRRLPRYTDTLAVAFIASLLGAVIWYGPVTQSATGLQAFTQALSSQGLDLLPNQTAGESPIAAYLNSTQQSLTPSQYEQAVHAQYVLEGSSITPLADADLPKYSLNANKVGADPPAALPPIHSALNLAQEFFAQILNLVGAIGALVLVFRRKAPRAARIVGFLSLGSTMFLILIRLSGTIATFYNAERALMQSLGVFAVTFCWVLERVTHRWVNMRNALLWIIALFLGGFIVNASGLIGAVLGGGTATNLANSGEDYERFYRTNQELAAASWLGSKVRSGQFVYADRYAELALTAMTELGPTVVQDVTPLTIDQHAWIYASTSNIVNGRARAVFENYSIYYTFPIQFLDENFDIVYSDGASEVFHR